MATTAHLDLSAWRNDDVFEFPLRVRGADLTEAGLVMEVRLGPDTPGAPLISLAKVTNGNAEGLRLAGVAVVDGLPESDVRIRINKTTLAGLPYAGEIGDSAEFDYALLLSGQTRLVGRFIVLASTYGSNAAPANRSAGYGTRAGSPAAGALLTIAGSDVAVLDLDAADLIGPTLAAAIDLVGEVQDQAQVSAIITEALIQAPAALLLNGNPNTLTADVPNAADETPFDVFILKTNTGPGFLTAGGITRAIGRDGGGGDLQAGDLPFGTVATFEYSPGGRFILTALRDIVDSDVVPSATYDSDFTNNPWGRVAIAGGSSTITQIQKYLVVPGSSNANSNHVSADRLPATVAATALNEFFPGADTIFNGITVAQDGAPMVTIMSQLANSPDYVAGRVSWVIPFYWMNDARTVYYHSEGGIMAEINAMRAAAKLIRNNGAELVLVTGFPPDPRAPTVALDPTWFAGEGSTHGMDYPVVKAAPVNPETQMQPRASQPLTGARAWTRSGIARTGYKRIWHVNRLIRGLAVELGCTLLDIEYSAYANAIEKVPDLGAGLDAYYDQSDPLHPKAALYDAAITPVLRQWALAVSQGRTDRQVFEGVA